MNMKPLTTLDQANRLFKDRYQTECNRVHQFMIWLMIAQWFAGIGFALFYSPFTWIGQHYEVHVHVWAAILLGGAISGFAILWTRLHPDSARTRHVIAISQMLWSALLIHLSGGRIETHFHVFASLAILSIYRDWKILITATVVVAVDHFIRGVFYPLSAFGIIAESPFRWIEHAAWVIFEVAFLAPGCMRLRNEILELCKQQTELELAKQSVDIMVDTRTRALKATNRLLAKKTAEAEKLALVARYTDNGVVITDGDAKIEWANEGFTRITGYQLHEVIGKRSSTFQHGPQTDPQTIARMRKAIKNKTGFDAEIINYRKSGEAYWLALEVRPIYDENGDVTRFIGIQSDVSKRKAMELTLESAQKRLRSLVDNVPGAIYRCRVDERNSTIFMSKSIDSITGYTWEDFTLHQLVTKTELIHREDKERVKKCMSLAVTSGEPFEIEYRIVDRSNNTKWVWEQGQGLTDEEGELVIDGTIFDITDRKIAEAELASKGKVIEDALNEIYIFDAATLNFRYVNRGGRANIGYTLKELEQLTPLDIKPDFELASFEELVEPLVSGKEQQLVFQTTHLRKNGTTYIAEIHLQKSLYQDRDVFLAMILDVSERIAAEKRTDQLQKDLVAASRKAGMAEVATGVLHNVGNILNSVNVSASLIQRKIEDSAFKNLSKASDLILEYQDGFADFVLNDTRGQKLPNYLLKVTDALSVERKQMREEFEDLLTNVEHIKEIVCVQQSMAKTSGVNQELCTQDLINDVLTATKRSLSNHGVQVVRDIETTIPNIISDKHKILQILINLVGNAKDALVENSTPDATIWISIEQEGDQVIFKVVDNGVGISQECIDKVFRHGFTTKENGHGFGLHSSANAATELGGTLTASSPGNGLGASFKLTIPINNSRDSKHHCTENSNLHSSKAD